MMPNSDLKVLGEKVRKERKLAGLNDGLGTVPWECGNRKTIRPTDHRSSRSS